MENKIRVDLSNTAWAECECGGMMFTTSMMFKKLSALMSPTGKNELVPLEVAVCTSCGKIPEFSQTTKDIPQSMRATKKNNL
jgi:hypothetical protein